MVVLVVDFVFFLYLFTALLDVLLDVGSEGSDDDVFLSRFRLGGLVFSSYCMSNNNRARRD